MHDLLGNKWFVIHFVKPIFAKQGFVKPIIATPWMKDLAFNHCCVACLIKTTFRVRGINIHCSLCQLWCIILDAQSVMYINVDPRIYHCSFETSMWSLKINYPLQLLRLVNYGMMQLSVPILLKVSVQSVDQKGPSVLWVTHKSWASEHCPIIMYLYVMYLTPFLF